MSAIADQIKLMWWMGPYAVFLAYRDAIKQRIIKSRQPRRREPTSVYGEFDGFDNSMN